MLARSRRTARWRRSGVSLLRNMGVLRALDGGQVREEIDLDVADREGPLGKRQGEVRARLPGAYGHFDDEAEAALRLLFFATTEPGEGAQNFLQRALVECFRRPRQGDRSAGHERFAAQVERPDRAP